MIVFWFCVVATLFALLGGCAWERSGKLNLFIKVALCITAMWGLAATLQLLGFRH